MFNCQFIPSAFGNVYLLKAFALSFFDEASKNPDVLSFSAKNCLEFFWRLSFFVLEFFENAQKISLMYSLWFELSKMIYKFLANAYVNVGSWSRCSTESNAPYVMLTMKGANFHSTLISENL